MTCGADGAAAQNLRGFRPPARAGGIPAPSLANALLEPALHFLFLASPGRKEVAMIAIRRILCPTDFSTFSVRARDHAVALARDLKARLTVLHVSPLTPMIEVAGALALDPTALTPEVRSSILALLADFAAPAREAGVVTDCQLREGAIAPEILAEARQDSADLLVLGTHGRGGFERLVLGSVAERLLRKAPCPVLTVGGAAGSRPPHTVPEMRRIVCPVDFSPTSILALRYAASLAATARGHLTVLHIVEWAEGSLEGVPYAKILVEGRERQCQAALQDLRKAVPEEARAACEVRERVVLGRPWRRILEVIDQEKADLAVLGVQGVTGFEQAFFGSTVNQVVRHAPCPVLTVREKVV